MGNKRKKGSRRYSHFGVAGGNYGLKARRNEKRLKNRVKKTLSTLNVPHESVSMCVKGKKGLKFTFAKLSVRRAKRYIIRHKETDTFKFHMGAADVINKLPGNRIINLNSLKTHVGEITLHSALCEKAREKALDGIDPIVLLSEKRHGLDSVLKCQCRGCGKEFSFNDSGNIDVETGKVKEINVKGVWGSMVTGGGASVMNEFLGTLGIPGLNPSEYTKTEQEIGEWWRDVLQEDMKEAGMEEKQHAIDTGSFHEGIPSIAVVCDGGWCKRSHKHTYNAMAGVAVIFGLHTKKLLHIGVRNKLCYICSAAQNKNETPRQHKCFKNWNESAQAMESDIILEGFLNCEQDHGVRYMKIIADGDSSVYANIIENVAGWGPCVEKIECANHACKCLRSHLEQLVVDKPFYKGKGKLTLINRKRIVQGVRCAIKMRSKESDIVKAKKKLQTDIRNCARHVLGLHDKCSTDFCKYKLNLKKPAMDTEEMPDNDIEQDQDAIRNVSEMWTDTMVDMSQEEEKQLRTGSSSQGPINEDLLKDLFFILNRMSNKSHRLISNFTSNLAECWMNVRCKFDGGKVTNRCFRGSFYARCYGGGLRSSRGPAWSPMVYGKVTGKRPDDVFVNTYRQRARHYVRTVKRQRNPATKVNRYKRKMDNAKHSDRKRAKQAYGPKVLADTADLPDDEIKQQCQDYYTDNVVVSENEACAVEVETRGQSANDKWKAERRKRLTSSVFGEIMSRGVNNNSPMLTKRLLYSNFGGNAFTRKGLMEEENTRKEYVNLKNKDKQVISHITVPGLVICKEYPFLAASSDGMVYTTDGNTGLVEIKNLLQNKNTLIKEAAQRDKNFCLHCTSSGTISLKTNHKFFFQVQGQLNVLRKDWCDFVVRHTDPYDIYVERINRDAELWEMKMLPKLKAYYFTHLLQELAVPRYRTISGIRKPSLPWYKQPSTCTSRRLAATTKGKGSVAEDWSVELTPHIQQTDTPPQPSVSATSVQSAPNPETLRNLPATVHKSAIACKREKRKQKIKFAGRRVQHRWENEDGEEQWYIGIVLGLVSGKDGDDSAVYQIQYTDDQEIYEVEDLYTDYTEGNLRFDDV